MVASPFSGKKVISFRRLKELSSLCRDLGLILGLPAVIGVGIKLYDTQVKSLEQQVKAIESQLKIADQHFKNNEAQIKAMEAQNTLLKETQFDRAFSLIESQKRLYELDKRQMDQKFDDLSQSINNRELIIDQLGKIIDCQREIMLNIADAVASGVANNAKKINLDFPNLVEGLCLNTWRKYRDGDGGSKIQ